MKKPTSVSGNRWTIAKRVDIEDVADVGNIYLTRFIIFLCPWFGIYLHKINRPDGDRNLHDHPWSFLAVILKGGYTEEVTKSHPPLGVTERHWGRWSVHRLTHGTFHRITYLHRVPTWSLCLIGRRRSDWGFYDAELGGWVQWEEYLDHKFPGWRGDDERKPFGGLPWSDPKSNPIEDIHRVADLYANQCNSTVGADPTFGYPLTCGKQLPCPDHGGERRVFGSMDAVIDRRHPVPPRQTGEIKFP